MLRLVSTGAGGLVAARYELLGLIGEGGMGRVWRARDTVLGRDVAVKEVRLRAAAVARHAVLRRTIREAQTAARIDHPNVVSVYDVVEQGGAPWIVMQLVRGESLQELVQREGRISWRWAAEIGAQVADGLVAAHAAGVVHRDLKPDNILLAGDRVLVVDFGIAHVIDATTLTGSNELIGTLSYMAPEQLGLDSLGEPSPEDPRKPVRPATDAWALGATLHAAVEGQPPFRARGLGVIKAILDGEPSPRPHAGPLDALIGSLLVKDPARRPDVAAVARALRDLPAAGYYGPPGGEQGSEWNRPTVPAVQAGKGAAEGEGDSSEAGLVADNGSGPGTSPTVLVRKRPAPSSGGQPPPGDPADGTDPGGRSRAGRHRVGRQAGEPDKRRRRQRLWIAGAAVVIVAATCAAWSLATLASSDTPSAGTTATSTAAAGGSPSRRSAATAPHSTPAPERTASQHPSGVTAVSAGTPKAFTVASGLSAFGAALSGDLLAVGTIKFPEGSCSCGATLWNTQNDRVTTLIDPGSSGATGVAFSPAGKGTLAVADQNGNVYLWAASNSYSSPVATLNDPYFSGGHDAVFSIAFSPDGKSLAGGDTGSHVLVWSLPSATAVGSAVAPVTRLRDPGNDGGVNGVAFSPDGSTVAAADANGTVYLWNVATGTGVPLADGTGEAASVAYSADGSTLAVGHGDGTVHLWSVSARTMTRKLLASGSLGVLAVAFGPGWLAADGKDGTAYLWSLSDWRQVDSLPGPSGAKDYRALAISGTSVATAYDDGTAYLWTVTSKAS
jgi:serine/threonine protein kinase/WD40 repeat protein